MSGFSFKDYRLWHPQPQNCWLLAPISIIRTDNPQDNQCACCRWNGEVSQFPVPHTRWSSNWVLLLFPGQDYNHQLLYIWVERGTVKKNCLFSRRHCNALVTRSARSKAQGWGVLPIMAYTGRLRPKGVPFSGLRYIKGQGFHKLRYNYKMVRKLAIQVFKRALNQSISNIRTSWLYQFMF